MKTAVAALLLVGSATAAMAQQNCGPRVSVLATLQGKYGESLQSRGTANGRLIEMWANAETGSWTVTVTQAGGPTCLLGAGENFERVDAAPAPMGQEH